jgi:hypothetical protein
MARSRPASLVPFPDVLTAFVKIHGLEARLLEFRVQREWSAIVGEHIGSHTCAGALRNGKLFLLAENSVWLQQLIFLKTELLAKITEAVGPNVVHEIVLRVGYSAPLPSPTSSAAESISGGDAVAMPDESAVGSDVLCAVRQSVQGIENPLLLERLQTLFLKSSGASSRVSCDQSRFETVFADPPPDARPV